MSDETTDPTAGERRWVTCEDETCPKQPMFHGHNVRTPAEPDAGGVEAEQYDGVSLTAACEAAGMRRAAWMIRERARVILPGKGGRDAT